MRRYLFLFLAVWPVMAFIVWANLDLNEFQNSLPGHWLIETMSKPPIYLYIWMLVIAGGIFAIVCVIVAANAAASRERTMHIRGSTLVTSKMLARITRGNKMVKLMRKILTGPYQSREEAQIEIAGVPMPLPNELLQMLISGSTGSGKTRAMIKLLKCALARGDRMIIVDPDGYFLARFGRPFHDVILNPFDRRSPAWNLFRELRKPYDIDKIARSIVPNATDSADQSWHEQARNLIAEIVRVLVREGSMDMASLVWWATQAEDHELATLLKGSAIEGIFQPGAVRALGSIRCILSRFVKPFESLRSGDFSLRSWLENEKGNLYITWRHDMFASLQPLISTWIDILISAILSLPEIKERPLWLFLDELASLERLASLEDGLTKGRKYGLRIVGCVQSVSQLEMIYGVAGATVLRSCFRNLLVLGGSATDPHTADEMSRCLGDHQIERFETHRPPEQHQSSHLPQKITERLVLPAEIMTLPPLHGFLKFAGDYPVAQVELAVENMPIQMSAFEEI